MVAWMSGYSAGIRHFRFAKVRMPRLTKVKTKVKIQPCLSVSCEQNENIERLCVPIEVCGSNFSAGQKFVRLPFERSLKY